MTSDVENTQSSRQANLIVFTTCIKHALADVRQHTQEEEEQGQDQDYDEDYDPSELWEQD